MTKGHGAQLRAVALHAFAAKGEPVRGGKVDGLRHVEAGVEAGRAVEGGWEVGGVGLEGG